MKRNISKKLAKRKRKIEKQVKNRNWQDQPKPMMAGGNIVYDIDGRNQAIANGGIGTIHQLAARSGLIDEINTRIDCRTENMNIGKIIRRFLIPTCVVTLIGLIKFKCKISPRAEVELSPNLSIGEGSQISSFTKIKSADGDLRIGKHVDIGTSCFISAGKGGVSIGDYAMVSPNVTIVGNNYKYDDLNTPMALQEKTSKGIVIERDVWLGSGVAVLDGAHIGEGAIVTPNSVVSGKVPARAIVQGNPAKKIFERR